jgi:hypothetical protein
MKIPPRCGKTALIYAALSQKDKTSALNRRRWAAGTAALFSFIIEHQHHFILGIEKKCGIWYSELVGGLRAGRFLMRH